MRWTEFAFSRDRARPCLSFRDSGSLLMAIQLSLDLPECAENRPDFVRKNTRALHQREVRINFEKLSPYCPRFFRAPEMAVTR